MQVSAHVVQAIRAFIVHAVADVTRTARIDASSQTSLQTILAPAVYRRAAVSGNVPLIRVHDDPGNQRSG